MDILIQDENGYGVEEGTTESATKDPEYDADLDIGAAATSDAEKANTIAKLTYRVR